MGYFLNSFPENIDSKSYNALKEIMKTKFHDFLQSYVDSMDKYIGMAETGLSQSDFRLVQQNVHPVKSTSYTLGAMKLGHMAEIIEDLIEARVENNDMLTAEEISPLYRDLADEYKIVRTFLLEEMANTHTDHQD